MYISVLFITGNWTMSCVLSEWNIQPMKFSEWPPNQSEFWVGRPWSGKVWTLAIEKWMYRHRVHEMFLSFAGYFVRRTMGASPDILGFWDLKCLAKKKAFAILCRTFCWSSSRRTKNLTPCQTFEIFAWHIQWVCRISPLTCISFMVITLTMQKHNNLLN